MEFFLNDPNIKRYPPADTRLLNLQAEPYPDGKRLRIGLELTPFLQKPYLEITLTDDQGSNIASTSIVEPTAWKLEFTLHLRKPGQKPQVNSGPGENKGYTLSVALSYPDLGEIDQRRISIQLPDPSS